MESITKREWRSEEVLEKSEREEILKCSLFHPKHLLLISMSTCCLFSACSGLLGIWRLLAGVGDVFYDTNVLNDLLFI